MENWQEVRLVDLLAVDWATVAIAVVLALGFVSGVNRGPVFAILDLLAVILALHMACRHYELIARLLRFVLNTSAHYGIVFGFAVVLVAMTVVFRVAASLLAGPARGVATSPGDRLLGGIAGAARSYVIVALIMWFIVNLPIGVLVPHLRESGVSVAVMRSAPVLFESIGVSLPAATDLHLVGSRGLTTDR